MKKMLTFMSLGVCAATLVGCACCKTPPPKNDLEKGMGPTSTVKMVSKEKMDADMASYGNIASSQDSSQMAVQPSQPVQQGEKLMPMPVDKTHPGRPKIMETSSQNDVSRSMINSSNKASNIMADEPPSYGKKISESPMNQDVKSRSYASEMNFPGQSVQSPDEPVLPPKTTSRQPQNLSPDESPLEETPSVGSNVVSPDEPVAKPVVASEIPAQDYNSSKEEKSEVDQLNKL